jgi:hypothetical protein
MTRQHITSNQPRNRKRRSHCSPWLLVGIAGAACLLMLLIPAACVFALPADGNGNYTQILCADPASEEGLGISGMPEGLTNPASIITWQISTTEVNCVSGHMIPGRGVPMAVGQANTYGQGTLEWHPFEGLLMALVAWTRKDVRDATNEAAVSAGVSPRSRPAGVGRSDGERRVGSVGVQRAVAA